MKTLSPLSKLVPLPPFADGCLVVVQEGRVVCIVEAHRREAVHSVARLLCRLLVREVLVYECTGGYGSALSAGDVVGSLPDGWNEAFRVRPWAEDLIAIH